MDRFAIRNISRTSLFPHLSTQSTENLISAAPSQLRLTARGEAGLLAAAKSLVNRRPRSEALSNYDYIGAACCAIKSRANDV